MSGLDDVKLDRHLDDPCPDCERAFRWCECSLPADLAPALQGSHSDVVLACERWLVEEIAGDDGPATPVLRLWGAYRRTRGWQR